MTSAVAALLLSQIVFPGCRSGPTAASRSAVAGGRRVLALVPNQAFAEKLTGGETNTYAISLPSHHYFRIIINRPSALLTAKLFDPVGQMLEQHTIRCYGVEPISLVSQSGGVVRLEVQTVKETMARSNYDLFVEDVREASARDDERLLADKAFAAAEGLRQQWSQDLFTKVLSEYSTALQYWKSLDDQRGQASALIALGELDYLSGRNQAALDYYNQAIVVCQNSPQPHAEIEAHNGAATVCIDLGNIADAFGHSSRARDLSRDAGDKPGEALALSNTGLGHYLSGELQKAIDYFEQSRAVARDAADPRALAQALINLGYAHQDLGELKEARNYYSESLKLWLSIDDRRQEAFTLTAIGNVLSFQDEKLEALKQHRQAADLFQQIGDQNGEAAALNGLGYVYDELGDPEKALKAYERSLELSRSSGNRGFECQTLGYIGRVHHAAGDKRRALDFFQQRLTLSRQIGDRRIEAHTLRDIGSILHSLDRKQDALRHYQQALALSRAVTDRRAQAYTLDYIGYVFDTSNRKQKALSYYLQALSLIRDVEDRSGETLTLYNIARAYREMGRLGEARANIETALKEVESLRTKIIGQALRTSYIASVHQYYELYIDVLMGLYKERRDPELSALAFEMSEKARARALLDSIVEANANIRQGVDPDLLDKERTIQQSLNTRGELRIRTLSGNHTEEEVQKIEQEINILTDEFRMVQAEIRERSPRYAALTQPIPLSLSEIQQQVLDSSTTLLEYSLGDRVSYMWAVTRDSITGYQLPSRRIIEGLSKRAYEQIVAQQPMVNETLPQYKKRAASLDDRYWRLAGKLSQTLLAPAWKQVGDKRLLIVADGALQYLAFSSFPVPNEELPGRRVTPLILEHEVVSAPSASAIGVLRKEFGEREPGDNTIAILADPVFTRDDVRVQPPANGNEPHSSGKELPTDLSRTLRDIGGGQEFRIPRLLSTRVEANSIVDAASGAMTLVSLDFDANLTRLTSPDLASCRILHLATHGVLNNDHPELSGVILSLIDQSGLPRDGFLSLSAVYNLKLKADLVVLSACNTSMGKDIRGEGLAGLTRGFMYAGAKRVIASLWRVNDVATSRLMSLFYKGIFKEGLQPTAALRAAQIEMWKRDRWKSPLFWAAFQVQGEWGPEKWRW